MKAKCILFDINILFVHIRSRHEKETPVGTKDYIYNMVSRKTDVYSYGCIIFELLTGEKSNLDLPAIVRGEVIKTGNLKNMLDKNFDTLFCL